MPTIIYYFKDSKILKLNDIIVVVFMDLGTWVHNVFQNYKAYLIFIIAHLKGSLGIRGLTGQIWSFEVNIFLNASAQRIVPEKKLVFKIQNNNKSFWII